MSSPPVSCRRLYHRFAFTLTHGKRTPDKAECDIFVRRPLWLDIEHRMCRATIAVGPSHQTQPVALERSFRAAPPLLTLEALVAEAKVERGNGTLAIHVYVSPSIFVIVIVGATTCSACGWLPMTAKCTAALTRRSRTGSRSG